MCAFLPDWQEESDFLADPEGPVAALEAAFPADAELSHRDILGALMGLGITREKLGDILLDHGRCQVLVLRDALPILLSQWESAGRWKMKLREIPLEQLEAKPPQVKTIRDTVAALRLDAVLAAGFSTSPVQGGGPGLRRPGVSKPPGVRQGGPDGGGGRRALLPGSGQVRGERGAGPV